MYGPDLCLAVTQCIAGAERTEREAKSSRRAPGTDARRGLGEEAGTLLRARAANAPGSATRFALAMVALAFVLGVVVKADGASSERIIIVLANRSDMRRSTIAVEALLSELSDAGVVVEPHWVDALGGNLAADVALAHALSRASGASSAVWVDFSSADRWSVVLTDAASRRVFSRSVAIDEGGTEARLLALAVVGSSMVEALLAGIVPPESDAVMVDVAGESASARRVGLTAAYGLSSYGRHGPAVHGVRAGAELAIAPWLMLALSARARSAARIDDDLVGLRLRSLPVALEATARTVAGHWQLAGGAGAAASYESWHVEPHDTTLRAAKPTARWQILAIVSSEARWQARRVAVFLRMEVEMPIARGRFAAATTSGVRAVANGWLIKPWAYVGAAVPL